MLLYGEDSEKVGLNLATQDIWMNGTAAIAFLFILVAASVASRAAPAQDASLKLPPGTVSIETFWPNTIDADVDLWVKGPTGDPIGYSNKGGVNYNLERDDLGIRSADDPVNYENTKSRGLTVGVNCVNLHLFRNNSKTYPVPVKVTVKIEKGENNTKSSAGPVLTSDVKLVAEGQELNIFCFIIDKDGNIPEGEKGVYHSSSIRLRSPS
ncbi:MAG: hypothetical protein V4436_01705 [Patescibacteria group bacterium]